MRVYHLGHCSFCLKKTRALLVDEGYVTRNLYRCSDCGRKLVVCRACNNLACWDSYTVSGKQVEQHDQFCGEHRGLVPNFDTQDVSLSSPVDWRTVYDHRSTNLAKVSAVTLAGIGGVAVAAPLAALAGPAIGGIIGAKFMGLSGVAATNAGLAFLGGGSLAAGGFGMAGGMAVVTAAGGILGGPLAAYLCNQYLGDISGFDIVQMRSGRQPAVITISGFLTEGQSPKSTWGQLLGRGSLFADHEWVHVRWEAKRLGALSKLAAHGGTAVLRKAAVEAAKKASKAAAKKLLPITAVADIAALATNPWHVALVKAEKTGVILADVLARCARKRYVIMGHSLGARVAHSALTTLGTKRTQSRIKRAVFLGGAVSNDERYWMHANAACTERPHNLYSRNDSVLSILYRAGTFFTNTPIGLGKIKGADNHDLSSDVGGHCKYWSREAGRRVDSALRSVAAGSH